MQGGERAASEPAGELPTVRVGTITFKSDAGFFLMAQEKGFFEEEGVKVEYTTPDSNVTLVKALVAGDLDVAETSPGPIFDAISQGAALKVIGGSMVGNPHVLYVASDIQTPADLYGRKVGISQPGSFLDELVTMYMLEEGADPSKIVRVNAGASSANVQALIAGQIDAGIAPIDYKDLLTKDGKFRILTRFAESLPGEVRFILAASDKTIRERPEELKAFMKGYARGLRYAIEHEDETIALSARTLNTDPDEPAIRTAYATQVENRLIAPDLAVSAEQMDFMQEARIIMKVADEKLPIDQVLDLSLQQQVAAELGPFQWPQ